MEEIRVSLFYAFYDRPDLVRAFWEIVTQTYIDCMRAWVDIVPFRQGGNAHWGLFHQGSIMLRDDSAMNLSPARFDAFVRPTDHLTVHDVGVLYDHR